MKLKQITVKQSLNKAYRLIKPERADIENFKWNFKTLLGHINPAESEENMKGHVMDFLKNTWYNPSYHIATKGRTDFVIHTGKDASHPAGVLFEAKKPSNHEMVILSDLNRKAMHEIILYFLRERIEHRNDNIKYLVITSIYEWFVFDAPQFEKLFYKNKFLVNDYKAWAAKQKVSANNDHFYNEIAKPFIASLADEIEFTYFDIRDYEKPLKVSDKDNDNKLIPLYKVLSPTHLLKLPFANDSNSLDKGFYNELLYIIGLEEVKEGNKKLICRRQEGKRIDGSLLENTIVQLETENCLHKVSDRQSYGETESDQLFSIALELCITWVNRVLFLKLLEAQLLKYHKGNENYRFLNYKTISQYDELYKLFFQVLARRQQDRIERVRAKYKHIPYLNSSLFDITTLEDQTIRINMLDDAADMPLLNTTVLKDDKNKPVTQRLNTLKYLFDFLNAYDFASEGSEEIQEERKTLINAAVLGLIFEKINGYKDGSIYTPGFITMYMCRQAIRLSVVSKFKEKYKWKVETFEDLHNYVSEDRSAKTIKEYNSLVNSLTICDPAVGSGHFLVSALNELIAIKSELGILADANGKRLADHIATVENDELLVTDKDRNFFTYYVNDANDKITVPNAEVQRVQETLFHEKQSLIENSLFGVDINPKSVQICRLRLWIELLKNAYYIAEGSKSNGELQTLPNIDINIKTGNSLVSRFGLDEDLKAATPYFEKKILEYKQWVADYKHEADKDKKRGIQQLMTDLKKGFLSKVTDRNPAKVKLNKITNEFLNKYVNDKLFQQNLTTAQKKDKQRLETEIDKLNKELEVYLKSPFYTHGFEWRFEFPEVLNDAGDFIGFDLIIGNPPYGVSYNEETKKYLKDNFPGVQQKMFDPFLFFIALSLKLLKAKGVTSYIVPNNLIYQMTFEKGREFLLNNSTFSVVVNLGDAVFDDADVPTCLYVASNEINNDYAFRYIDIRDNEEKDLFANNLNFETYAKSQLLQTHSLVFGVSNTNLSLINKLASNSVKLDDIIDVASYGIGTGGDKIFRLKDDYCQSKGLEEQILHKVISGGNIVRYGINYNNEKIIYTTKDLNINSYPNIYNHLTPFEKQLSNKRETKKGILPWWCLHWARNKNLFLGEKIILRQTGDRIIATYDAEDYFVMDSVMVLKLKKDTDFKIKYILGILNSKLSNFLYSNIAQEKGRAFAQVKPQNIRQLLIKRASFTEAQEIILLVDIILTKKKSGNLVDTAKEEQQIDHLVYKLYKLSPEEIEIVKQATTKPVAVV